ncbi:TetR/AcrR family transcriptional regulator [Yinghuangia sp. ASG 101]|uniref:TetR/AcrR family transcriptional regulator n=1 Tax=Yinghuangia sp. ASG 101 TaxID=2896848 RepID=UPI001E65CA23|nr:TetR/AcrR family transcriptional regulator [Yinghuangia sp. ASG 101]UGQ12375.1 TetR/AcrR family transcriptional regulator [Yinghuangia sp. ASG 101]
MAEPRRRRAATAEKLTRLLDATEDIILNEGYAAVSSRSVAARVNINAPLVHYYFPKIDDLFAAVLRRRAEQMLARMTAALASAEPLRAWWELASDPRGSTLLAEMVAAANHRPALRAEVGKVAHELRRLQIDALDAILGEYGLDPDTFPPALIAATVQGLAYAVVMEEAGDFDTRHGEARAAMDRLLTRLERRRSGHPQR